MAVFGKTPLTKAVSQFAGDFNLELQSELELLYAPQAKQLSALQEKMTESQSYDAGKEQLMARMIAADRGMDSVESTALARMLEGQFPGTGKEPLPDAPPEDFDWDKMRTEQNIALNAEWLKTASKEDLGRWLANDLQSMNVPQDIASGIYDESAIGPPRSDVAPPLGYDGRWITPQIDLFPGGLMPNVETPWGDAQSGIGNIAGRIGDFFGGAGSAIGDFATDPVHQQLFGSQEGLTTPGYPKTVADEMITDDLTLDVLASYPTWSTTDKILEITGHLKDIYEDTGGGPAYDAKVRQIAGYVGENEGDTVVRSAITSMVNELDRDFVDSVSGPVSVPETFADRPVTPSYIEPSGTVSATDSTGDREVTEAIAANEEVQAKVDGSTWLDWLSEVDSGKSLIYNVFKGENPTFRMMNPRAEGLYNRWERQLRHQFNIELTNPNSPWNSALPTGSNKEGAEIVNRNYKEYLRAAFDPENRTANLWNRDDWQRNMEQVSANTSDLMNQSSLSQGAVAGEEAIPQDRMLGGALESLARDPETVKQWIIAKSTKGANPIVARYAPQSIGREIDKWVMDNTKIPTLTHGTPTSDYEEQGEAASVAAQSLFQEWAKRDFRWFGSNGYGRD